MITDEFPGPLCKAAEGFLNVSATAGLPGALDLYEKLEAALKRENPECDLFVASLSDAQITSLRVIQEWWSFSIEHEPWFAENPDRAGQMRVLDMYPFLEGAEPMVVSLLFGIDPPIPKISTYRLQVYRLFQMEFDVAEFGKASDQLAFLGFLQEQRRLASFYAAIQRVTVSFRLNAESIHADLDPSPASGTHILAQRPLGTSVEPCPWLKFRKSATGYPYFLWHVDKRCTIEVQNLEPLPNYTCVSHTWGRWRDESIPGIKLPGVPWLVPRNTRFHVESLPDRLAECFPGWYIWLDLFCIPQDGSSRAATEIARQAEIFGNARTTIAWLNDITDWTGLRQTIRWLCEFCLANDLSINTDPNLPPDLDDTPTGLLIEAPATGEQDQVITPAPWLTSLWTLQEACLRPDMILCKDDFEFLTVKEGHNTVVTLEILVALMNYAIGSYSQSPYETVANSMKPPKDIRNGTILEFEELNSPASGRQRRILEELPEGATGVIELYDALLDSGMTSLYRLSPVSILTLGHHRQCTSSNRAEAIMSVTGATQWYQALTEKKIAENSSSSENELIMEFYPLDFLQEVIRNVGALFFATVTSDLALLNPVVDTNNEGWVPLNPRLAVGSMLPFRSVAGHTMGRDYAYTETSDHPATTSWLLRHDGSVFMEFAGIVSSSQDPLPSTPLRASIRVPGHFSTGISERCNLHEWVRNFRLDSSCANFAVSLRQETKKFQNGIILKQIDGGTVVKIGTFVTDEITVDKVETQLVSWIVL